MDVLLYTMANVGKPCPTDGELHFVVSLIKLKSNDMPYGTR